MNITCETLTSNYTEHRYRPVNDEKFTSILQPLLAMIQHKLKGNYLYGEEYLIAFLRENRTSLSADEILDLSRHMSTCVAHFYIILITAVLSVIIGFPLVFCSKTCYKKVSSPKKHQYRLCTQGILFTGALTFLLLGCISSWSIGSKAHKFMKRFPQECIDMIEALNETRTEFNSNCRKMQSVIATKLPTFLNLPHEIYRNISYMVDEATNQDYQLLLKKFDSLTLKIQEIYDSMEFSSDGINAISGFDILCDALHYKSLRIFERLSSTLPRSSMITYENESVINSIIFSRNYKHLNWVSFYYDVIVLLKVMLPNTNTSIHFVNTIKQNLENVRNESIAEVLQQIQNPSFSLCFNLSRSMDKLVSTSYEKMISNISRKMQNIMAYPLLHSSTKSDLLKVATWAFVFPSVYGFVVFFLFLIAVIGTCKEIKGINKRNISDGIYTITFYRIAIYVSIIFLWLILLIAAFLYFVHIPAVVICGAAKKGKLIHRYLDKPYWNNQTWLTYKLNKSIVLPITPVTVKTVLEKCSQNKTIVNTLCLGKVLSKTNLQNVLEKSRKRYSDIFTKQKFPKFKSITAYIYHIDQNYLDPDFALRVNHDVKKFEDSISSLKEILFGSSDTSLKQEVNDAVNLVGMVKNFTHRLMEAKLLIAKSKVDLIDVILLNTRLEIITKTHLHTNVNAYFHNITNYVNCFHKKITRFIKYSLLEGFGTCTALPYVYKKLEWICDYGLEVLNCFWLSLAILGFSILIGVILGSRLACFVRGSYSIATVSQYTFGFDIHKAVLLGMMNQVYWVVENKCKDNGRK